MSLQTWIATHKAEAGLGAAGAVAMFALYRRAKTASAGASTGATPASMVGNSPYSTISGVYPYSSTGLDQYNQLANAISNANDSIQSIQASLAAKAAASTPAGPTNGLGNPFNPYPVGTLVQPGEKIVQADPVSVGGVNGFVDVTSLGGLYTTPGLAVNGSAINAHPPAGFGYSAQVNGGTVYEYTPSGVQTFQVRKA